MEFINLFYQNQSKHIDSIIVSYYVVFFACTRYICLHKYIVFHIPISFSEALSKLSRVILDTLQSIKRRTSEITNRLSRMPVSGLMSMCWREPRPGARIYLVRLMQLLTTHTWRRVSDIGLT